MRSSVGGLSATRPASTPTLPTYLQCVTLNGRSATATGIAACRRRSFTKASHGRRRGGRSGTGGNNEDQVGSRRGPGLSGSGCSQTGGRANSESPGIRNTRGAPAREDRWPISRTPVAASDGSRAWPKGAELMWSPEPGRLGRRTERNGGCWAPGPPWMMRDQGRLREAYDLLAPVYGWFTEGFPTKNLREAKVLLEGVGVDPVIGISLCLSASMNSDTISQILPLKTYERPCSPPAVNGRLRSTSSFRVEGGNGRLRRTGVTRLQSRSSPQPPVPPHRRNQRSGRCFPKRERVIPHLSPSARARERGRLFSRGLAEENLEPFAPDLLPNETARDGIGTGEPQQRRRKSKTIQYASSPVGTGWGSRARSRRSRRAVPRTRPLNFRRGKRGT